MNFQPPMSSQDGLAQGFLSQKGQPFIPALLLGAELTVTVNTQLQKAVPILKHHPHGDALVGVHLEPVESHLTLNILHHF